MNLKRYTAFFVVIAVSFVFIFGRLVNLQIANGNYYRQKSDSRTVRSIELAAPRGEILDRNGRAIVTNRTGYSVYIHGNSKRKAPELNNLILNLYRAVKSAQKEVQTIFPISVNGGKYSFSIDGESEKAWKKKYGFKASLSADEIMNELKEKYEITGFSKEESLFVTATRFNMVIKGFSISNPYMFMEDTPLEEISVVKEQGEKFPGVSVVTQPVRSYPYTTLGAHLLGRVGLISSEEYEENKESGYSFNSHIGKSGIEKLFEEFLKGESGAGTTLQNSDGYSIGYSVEKEPISGRNVTLTIDLDMQIAAENALRDTILELSSASGSAEGGRDANAGSVVVIDVNTGDVLAMASYPSYDIETFTENYNNLLNAPGKPLFNRALSGTYSPASTFKPLVGAIVLEEKIITPEEKILDTGKYTFFKDYQPACWIYNQSNGGTHGYVNVAEAICESCNIFFFDVGRRLGIDKINQFASKLGFGQKSGIELESEEKSGVVANPENRKKNGGIWYPGDVCQTAIGQSDTLVTPIQLANYIATVANGGTRYRPHLVKSIETAAKTPGEESKPEILNAVELSDTTRNAITDGMRMVVTKGTAFSAFAGCKTDVAAKTGSAQTSSVYTDGLCVAYAPYDKPQIAIACVIEKAGSGAKTATVIRKIVDSYFDKPIENDMKTNVLMR